MTHVRIRVPTETKPAFFQRPDARWTLRGFLFGLLFPAGSILFVAGTEPGASGFFDLHLEHPLLFVIDLAPMVLAAAGWLIGRLVGRLQEAEALQRSLADRVSETWELDVTRHVHEVSSLAHQGVERAAAVSHELRTPLTAMLGFVELLLAELDDQSPHTLDYLTEIKASGEFMLELVNEFLDAESNVADLFEVHNVSLDASDVVAAVVRHLAPMATKRGLLLTFDDDLSGPVSADPTRLRQVLTNLVVNSIRYTPAGSVSIAAHDRGGQAVITIADSGVGMTEEELSRLFRPYERGTSVKEVGTGLGLGLARSMVKAMDGTLTASSPGRAKGSVMTIVLPLAPEAMSAGAA